MIKKIDDTNFYAIAVCSNPVRYHSRYRLFQDFRKHMADCGFKLLTVECAYGEREHELTSKNNPYDMQFRTRQELWHKENMINLGIQYLTQLDPNWKYIAWIDGDITFQRPDIAQETIHQLQHYDFVQLFSHVIDSGPRYEPVQQQNGFVWSYFHNNFEAPVGPGYTPKRNAFPELIQDTEVQNYYGAIVKGSFWHCGYAWAARREALEKLQLFDKAILGSADHHMAMALIGQAQRSIPRGVTYAYYNAVINWQDVAEQEIKRNIGYVPGTIFHHWHGNKVHRKYVDRWKILIDYKYDPMIDILREPSGLYRLNMHHGDRSRRLRDHIRHYFRQRNEDSVDLF